MVLLLAASLSACAGAATGRSPLEVEIAAADGAATSLAAYAGIPLVVNLWATWCAPCVAEMPVFDEVAESFAATTDASGRVQVLGVNVGDSADEARDFAVGLGVSYPILTDPDGRLSAALGVTGLPATAFVAADGTIIEVRAGAFTRPELIAAISKHFGTAPS